MLYVPILVALLKLFGIQGAAIAWTVRVGLDLGVRVAIASRLAPALRLILIRSLVMVGIATALIASPLVGGSIGERVAVVLVAACFYAFALLGWGVTDAERTFWSRRLRLRAMP